jgi:hypothetical protein
MSGSGNPSQIALMFEAAKNLNQIEFDKFVKGFGLGTESCKCSSCFNDNPKNCYTKSGAPLMLFNHVPNNLHDLKIFRLEWFCMLVLSDKNSVW